MIVTNREDIADRISKQRAFGIDKSVLADRRHTGAYEIEYAGLNYRMGEMGAAMGVVQLGRLPGFLETRERNYDLLAEGLGQVEELELLRLRPRRRAAREPLLPGRRCCATPLAARREGIIEALKAEGIGTSVYYPKSLPDTKYYAQEVRATRRAPARGRRGSAPTRSPSRCAPHVTETDIERIVEAVKESPREQGERLIETRRQAHRPRRRRGLHRAQPGAAP